MSDPNFSVPAADLPPVEPAPPTFEPAAPEAPGSRFASEAAKLRDAATGRARDAAEDGKTRAADAIDEYAQMAHDAASRLEAQTSPEIAAYAHRAADALDGFSDTLRTKSVDELIADVGAFARQSPAIALGAAVAVGFALTRFVRSGGPVSGAGGYRGLRNRSGAAT